MEKHIIVNNELYTDKVLDKKGNVISLKKRVNDIKIIKHLLSSNSKHKLSLKQYKFLKQMEVRDKVTPGQRDWLKALYSKSV
tara:strand:+ start:1045 stop:1290 length:246 start_codon:yes stop_codon:yes gene_type:complete